MSDLTPADVLAILDQAEPYTPQAVTLLRESRATGIAPDTNTIAAATSELVRYTKACAKFAGRLTTLDPVPVEEPRIVEAFSL